MNLSIAIVGLLLIRQRWIDHWIGPAFGINTIWPYFLLSEREDVRTNAELDIERVSDSLESEVRDAGEKKRVKEAD